MLATLALHRATLVYVVFGCIVALLGSFTLLRTETYHDTSIDCAARGINPLVKPPPTALSREQALVKLHFHRQQMMRQEITNDSIGRTFFQRNWEPSMSCTALARLGCAGDGGKWVCDPHRYLGENCLVYSFGSNNEFSFEEAVHHFNPHCEIHTFDPFVSKPINKPQYVNFHPWGIAAHDSAAGSIYSLPAIMQRLGHTNVSILKIDCEGCELDVFNTHDFPSQGGAVQQILMEVHFGGKPERVHRLFNFLTESGYAIVNKEANIQFSDGDAVEFSLIHLNELLRDTG